MAISLNKGGNLSLSKTDPNLVRVLIGLGWDERATDGAAFDLDASAFLLTAGGKVRGDHDFIFYNQLKSQDGAVEHTGDNRSGQGDGDDETLLVNLSKVAPEVEKIAITVTIHDAKARGQNFGQIANAFIRVVNQDTNVEVVRFDLAEDYSTETAMVFGEVYRHNGEWKFKAVGQGYSGGLAAMCQQYGIQVG
ncbi:chemical-damaging agent resistance protein C [Acinetobacter baumannii]|uniref:TerD family protein n=1 Tax=Acinetobacter TaxID=469 RepID=UPI0005759B65|nr:TerD family protein [Acinetobacter seifertii]KHO14332.1 chemical-damaging agent resistance protein C [Acinetobacter baumannii]OCZ62451.1 chemical-damaging agent resistance protein C [Acinetobacter seifertii]PTV52146.1 TerD family protein [Acinetobacter seifertii]QNX33279.1 TerD family protein [Acinetobacter seifertii]